MRSHRKKSRIKGIFLEYINSNLKEFLIVTIIFVIGVVFGVMYINNINELQETEVKEYIQNFVNSLKEGNTVDKGELIKQSVKSNLSTTIVLWFAGCTVIGIPILYGFVGYRGFCLGYTISSVILSLGTKGGIIFSLTSLLLQNIIYIPIILALAVSGIRLYKSIMKDKAKDNIKMEICRHTIFSCILLGILIAGTFVETYVSTNLFLLTVKYI